MMFKWKKATTKSLDLDNDDRLWDIAFNGLHWVQEEEDIDFIYQDEFKPFDEKQNPKNVK